nr:hypothetical protein CFP56_04227 [Quercus suber]
MASSVPDHHRSILRGCHLHCGAASRPHLEQEIVCVEEHIERGERANGVFDYYLILGIEGCKYTWATLVKTRAEDDGRELAPGMVPR